MRKNIIPIFEKINPNFHKIFKRNLKNLNEIFTYCDIESKQWIDKNKINDFEIPKKSFLEENIAIQKSILINLYINLYRSTQNLTTQILELSLEILKNKDNGKKTNFGQNFYLIKKYKTIEIIPKKQPVKISKKKLKLNGKTIFKYGEFDVKQLTKRPKILYDSIYLDYSKLDFPLYIRSKKNGDRIHPLGMKGSKKLQDIFTDKKIPQHQRIKIPVIVDANDQIVAFDKNMISEKHKITKKTTKIMKLKLSLS